MKWQLTDWQSPNSLFCDFLPFTLPSALHSMAALIMKCNLKNFPPVIIFNGCSFLAAGGFQDLVGGRNYRRLEEEVWQVGGSPGSHLVDLVCGDHLDTWVTLFTWWVAGQVPQLPWMSVASGLGNLQQPHISIHQKGGIILSSYIYAPLSLNSFDLHDLQTHLPKCYTLFQNIVEWQKLKPINFHSTMW